jgi:hypothetical protein
LSEKELGSDYCDRCARKLPKEWAVEVAEMKE